MATQASAAAGISPREAEVLALVGEHRSNAEIGARLFISVRTVETHVSSLLRKLGVPDRRALASVAGELARAERSSEALASLPSSLTSFVGRKQERVALGEAIRAHRQVTAVGPGGVNLDAATVAVLERWRETQGLEASVAGEAWEGGDDPYVLTDELGRPLHPDAISNRFEAAQRGAEVPRIPMHGLRHTAATLALKAGGPVHVDNLELTAPLHGKANRRHAHAHHRHYRPRTRLHHRVHAGVGGVHPHRCECARRRRASRRGDRPGRLRTPGSRAHTTR